MKKNLLEVNMEKKLKEQVYLFIKYTFLPEHKRCISKKNQLFQGGSSFLCTDKLLFFDQQVIWSKYQKMLFTTLLLLDVVFYDTTKSKILC